MGVVGPPLQVNVEESFRDNAEAVEDDHIDLEWFGPGGELLWSTFADPPRLALHVNTAGETVHFKQDQVLRQITHRVQKDNQVLGYLRVSHPWFEVTKPSRQLIWDLGFWSGMMVAATAMIGWLLSGLAMAPVRNSYQQLKQFTADASHELRNPIAVIQTNVQVALADPDAAFQQSQLQVIERLTRRLGRLVDNLLFLARQESGLTPIKPEAVNLKALISEVVEEQQVLAAEQQISLRFEQISAADAASREPVYELQADRDQLLRLLTNLIGNALQYTPVGGQVQVTLQSVKVQGSPSYQITVQDTGMGISAEALPYVFDRFYRADPARSHRGGGGSGLGLAIAKAIVEAHQGQISLTSTPGKSTCVMVNFPQGRSL
jgi:OmpR-family two-component system manganese-sensing sensor histidine kinase